MTRRLVRADGGAGREGDEAYRETDKLKEEMGKVAVYRKQMLVSPVAVGHGKAHSWI